MSAWTSDDRKLDPTWTPAFAGATREAVMKQGFVYIMANKPFGTLYIGVTGNIAARIWQHRTGDGSDHCSQHGLTRLVYVETHLRIEEAIAREKAMKAWKRNWKLRQIMAMNPDWNDLYDTLNH